MALLGHKLSMGTRTNVDGSETSTFGNWAYVDGTVTASDGNVALNVTAGGRVLVGAGANHDDGTTVLLIFTRSQ